MSRRYLIINDDDPDHFLSSADSFVGKVRNGLPVMGKQNAILLGSPFKQTPIISTHQTDVLDAHKIEISFTLLDCLDNGTGKVLIRQDRNHALLGRLFAVKKNISIHGDTRLLQFISYFRRLLLSTLKVFLDLVSVLKVIGNRSVRICQAQRRILSNNVLGGVPTEVAPNHQIEKHPCLTDTYGALVIETKRNVLLKNFHFC